MAFEKYEPRGLFSEFYGMSFFKEFSILQLCINGKWAYKYIEQEPQKKSTLVVLNISSY